MQYSYNDYSHRVTSILFREFTQQIERHVMLNFHWWLDARLMRTSDHETTLLNHCELVTVCTIAHPIQIARWKILNFPCKFLMSPVHN